MTSVNEYPTIGIDGLYINNNTDNHVEIERNATTAIARAAMDETDPTTCSLDDRHVSRGCDSGVVAGIIFIIALAIIIGIAVGTQSPAPGTGSGPN